MKTPLVAVLTAHVSYRWLLFGRGPGHERSSDKVWRGGRALPQLGAASLAEIFGGKRWLTRDPRSVAIMGTCRLGALGGVFLALVGCGSSAFPEPDAGTSGSSLGSASTGSTSGAGTSSGAPSGSTPEAAMSGAAGSSSEATGATSGGVGATAGASGSRSTGGDVACTPGLSVACVGVGGCMGGQACKLDGSGYGMCVCAASSSGSGSGSSGATSGGSGSSGTSSGSAAESSSGSGLACLPPGTVCTGTPRACCSGICEGDAADPTQPSVCADACHLGSDCESGCCVPISAGATVMSCAPRGFCSNTCVVTAASCTATTDCCLAANGAAPICIAFPSGPLCGVECTANSQCDSGCCRLLMGSATSACLPASYCQ